LKETHDYQVLLEEEVQKRTRELKESNSFKEKLIGNVSHDFRTPLTSLIGYSELLATEKHGPLTGEQREFLEIIRSNAERMQEIVRNTAQWMAAEGKPPDPTMETLDLLKIAFQSVQSHNVRAHDLGVNLELRCEGEDFWILGSEILIGSLVDNLISNAVKYTNPGGRVTVRLAANETDVRLRVEDTGIGIREEDLPRIFDRFFQADHGTREYAGGLGIGLSICKEIADLHEADIQVESKEGEGTAFEVTFPDRKP
jgi:signal transduction histidine kinase